MGKRVAAMLACVLGITAALQAPAAAATEVFSGWIVSTDRNRYRLRVRTPTGERRVVWMQVQNVWRGGSLVGRKVLRRGQRVLVTAKRGSGREWKATRVQMM